MEWLIGGVVVWFIYRILTVGSRRNKYFMEAIIWKTGGMVGTGTIDIHQAVSLFEKASSLGHAQASFELGAIYEDGWSHPSSSQSSAQIKPNEALSGAYFRKCQTQSPEVYSQLKNERKQMQAEIKEHLESMMQAQAARRNSEDNSGYEEDEDFDDDEYEDDASEGGQEFFVVFNELKPLLMEMQYIEGFYPTVNYAIDGFPVLNAARMAEMDLDEEYLQKTERCVKLMFKLSKIEGKNIQEIFDCYMRGTWIG